MRHSTTTELAHDDMRRAERGLELVAKRFVHARETDAPASARLGSALSHAFWREMPALWAPFWP
jgi:hypothetical protein